jgi:hypothetical protein
MTPNPAQQPLTLPLHIRDEGMTRAVDKADREESQWSGQALGYLRLYAASNQGHPFLIEEVRAWAELQGLPAPSNAKAWGAVTRRAAHRKNAIIAPLLHDGAQLTRKGAISASPKPLWREA